MERVSSIDGTTTGREVFALTDEQILGMEPEGEVARGTQMTDEQLLESAGRALSEARRKGLGTEKRRRRMRRVGTRRSKRKKMGRRRRHNGWPRGCAIPGTGMRRRISGKAR